jgi:cytochrome P450
MVEQVDLFIKLLLMSSKDSTPVNVTERVTYLACDLIALLSLGFPLKLQTEPTYRFMVPGMFSVNHLANTRMQWFRLHQLRLVSLLNFFTNDALERYMRLMEKMITTRLSEDKNARHDLFSIMSNASIEGGNIGVSEILTEAISFFPAGT